MLGLSFREDEWSGRVVNLASGEDTTFEIGHYEMLRAAERVRESVGAMQALLAEPGPQRPPADGALPAAAVRAAPELPLLPILDTCLIAEWSAREGVNG